MRFKVSKQEDAVVYESPSSDRGKDFVAKIVIIGDKASGKTTLAKKYCTSVFKADYLPTLGANLETKRICLEHEGVEKNLTFQLWDLAGDEHFGWVRKSYYNGTAGCVMVVDLTRDETLKHIEGWFHEMYHSGVDPVVPTVLMCNKADLQSHRQVHPAQVKEMLNMIYDTNECRAYRKLPIQVFETSAKDGRNVEAAFTTLGHMFMKKNASTY